MTGMFNNTSLPLTQGCSAHETDSAGLKALKTVLFSLIIVTSLFGNVAIVIIICTRRELRQNTNVFIANMAVSDTLTALVAIPRILTELYVGDQHWLIGGPLGTLTCKLVFFLQDVSIFISIASHASIAVDRFWAIVFSLRSNLITPKRRKAIIGAIWFVGVALNSPAFYKYTLRNFNGITFCIIDWSPFDFKQAQKTFFGFILIVVILIPLITMITLYTSLTISIIRQSCYVSRFSGVDSQRRKEDIRVVARVVVILVVFLCSILPLMILGLLLSYVWDWQLPCNAWDFAFAASFVYLSNCAVNPCLCIALNRSYYTHVKRIMRCGKRNHRNRETLTKRFATSEETIELPV